MALQVIKLIVNGEERRVAIEPQWTLAEVLREQLHLTGTKIGCDLGSCGACTVLCDGKPVLSCLTLALTVDGCTIQTIEGIAAGNTLHPLQRAFIDHGAVQCGFCTPGMILASNEIVHSTTVVDEAEIREQLSGNLCRCTGYTKIVESVQCAREHNGECGKHAPKVDGIPKVTGSAQYADDLNLPRMLFAKFLRSPYAHARILSIDTSKAEQFPGVVAVMTGKELTTRYGILPSTQDETVLCIDKVRYVGDGVAAVAAIDERTAQEALKLIDVRYEVLPPVLSIEDAMRTDLPKIHEDTKYNTNATKLIELEFGNTAQGFAEAEYIREDEFFYGANTHAMLEPHSVLASFEPSANTGDYKQGHLTLWSSTQTPHYVHRTLARVLDMPASHIRVVKPHLGGGFGGKSEPLAFEFVAPWLSIKTGRPVKITYTREEVFYSHRGRHATKMWIKTGVKKDGSITAIQYKAWLDGGAYGSFGIVTSYYTGQFLTMPYHVPNFKFESTRLYTNKPAAGPKRGHGAPQPRFAFEVQLDRIAEALNLDPIEIRLRNHVRPNSMTINSLRITSCGIRECIENVVKASHWRTKRGKLPPGRGIGIAASAYISGAGKEIYWQGLPHSGAIVKIDRGGGVVIFCGSSDIGQGSSTALATIAAETFGLTIDQVKVCEADTDLTPVDLGSYSSRVTFMAGNAVLRAVSELKGKLLDAAAEKLNVAVNELQLQHGFATCTIDSSKSMSFIEAARLAEAKYGTLSAVGSYSPPPLGGTYKGAGAGPSPAYSFTAHVAEVEVDFDTGKVTVCDVWSAHDCGKAINKELVEGQIEGSVYMGVGEALYEEMNYTRGNRETPGGALESPSLLEYKLPTALDTPQIHASIVESMDPEGPLGAKEAGEGPLLAVAPAIANAIYDAVGVRVSSIPIRPETIRAAMKQRASSPAGATVEAIKS